MTVKQKWPSPFWIFRELLSVGTKIKLNNFFFSVFFFSPTIKDVSHFRLFSLKANHKTLQTTYNLMKEKRKKFVDACLGRWAKMNTLRGMFTCLCCAHQFTRYVFSVSFPHRIVCLFFFRFDRETNKRWLDEINLLLGSQNGEQNKKKKIESVSYCSVAVEALTRRISE